MSSTKSTGSLTPQTTIQDDSIFTGDPIMATTLTEMSQTLDYIAEAFSVLDDCMQQFSDLSTRSDVLPKEIQSLLQGVKQHDLETKNILTEMKAGFRDEIDQQVIAFVKANSSDWIREEASMQVKEQVDIQIVEHLPESLQHQADESKRQLDVIKISLKNSESRMTNSFIQSTNTNDPLAVILTPRGKKSPLYPPNTRCLFGYDLDSAKALCKDYDLAETDDLLMNFQQFLKHIGTNIEVLVSP